MTAKNLVSQPPLTTPISDSQGVLTKAWAIWFRDMYRRTAFKGGNAIDENKAEADQDLVDVDAALNQTIASVNQNILDINENEGNITTNTSDILTNKTSIEDHKALTEAHGSNGDIVGKDDLATESLVGLVKQMALVSDAVTSTVSVDSADIAAAPATYDQTYTDTVKTLSNEMKADINQLVTDVNNAITQINAILANSKTSGQMNNV